MTAQERYIPECEALLDFFRDRFSQEEVDEVTHLIDHGEAPDAMRTLAGIIVEENKTIPAWAVDRILYLMGGGIPDPPDLPELLQARVEGH